MRKKQGLRIVSSILAASMALTMMPTAAFAAGTAGTSGVESSAAVQDVGTEDTLTTLKFENGIPTSSGSAEEGWTYQEDGVEGMRLTIYNGYTFDRDIVVKCNVQNWGTIKAGTFEEYVYNGGEPDSRGVGKIEGNVTIHSVQNYGVIDGGTYDWVGNNSSDSSIKNADIGVLDVTEGSTVENCVFGLSNQEVPKNVHTLTFSVDAKVNGVITTRYQNNNLTENYRVVCVAGNREVTVVYDDDEDNFVSWKADPEVNWTESDDKKTVTFTPDKDMTMTINETVMPLEFDTNGKPTKKGNKTSKWEYNGNTLTLYEGYTFDQDVTVDCNVYNYGTIAAGTFKQYVANAGTIKNGLFTDGANNYIQNSSFDGNTSTDTYLDGTITGGVFAYVCNSDDTLPANTYILTALGGTINDAIPMAAYIVGDNQKIKVTRDADDEDFESWKEVDGITISDPTAKTIEFVMPAKNVALGINYKDNALEFDANGNPTHAGGKNWERIQTGSNDGVPTYGLILKDGAVLDTDGTVKCQIVAYPGSTIRNGVFEEAETGDQIMNFGTIENGTFDITVTNAGTIQNGDFNKVAMNMNIKLDSEMDLGSLGLGVGIDAIITDCPGLISGGTFHESVENVGIIEGGIFYEEVLSMPIPETAVEQLKKQGITFTSVTRISGGKFAGEVTNAGEITGGQFRAGVTNIGTIENGLFSNDVNNTTSANMTESMSDGEVATMALFGDATYAVEMQNSASTQKTYVGTIKDGNFGGTVTNNGGQITGGVFWNKIEGDAVANVHTLTANDSHIGAGNPDASGSRALTRDQVYTVGKECVYVSYAGTIDFGSWKTNDVDLSTAVSKKIVIFTMPGDKDVTLTASAEKPVEDNVIVVKPDEKPNNEGKTIEEDLNNQGTLNNGTYTGEVTNANTIEGGTFTGNVSNDEKGKISDGEFKAAVQNAGTIENGKFAAAVTNDETGKIANGEFTGEVENKGTIQNGTFADTVTNNGTIENGKFAGEVKGTGTINGGTFQQVSEAAAINGGVFGKESNLKTAKVTPSTLKIETGIADGSVVNDVIGGGAAVAMFALFEENDVATQAADAAETVAYVVGDQTLTVKYSGSDKNFDKWDTTGLTDAKLSEDGKTVTFKMSGDVTLKAVAKKSDSGNTDKPNTDKPAEEPSKPQQPAKNDSGAGALIVGGVLVAGGVATGVLVYKMAVEYIQAGLPEGAAIPETREQLAVALWQKAGQPEVAAEEGVTLTDTEKAMRWAVANQLVSAEGEDSVDKIDVLLAVYKASKL